MRIHIVNCYAAERRQLLNPQDSRVSSFLFPGFDNIYILICFKSFHWNSVLSPASARNNRLWQTLHISSQLRSFSRTAASATHVNTVNSLHTLKNADCQFVLSPSTRHRISLFKLSFTTLAIAAHMSLLILLSDFSYAHRWQEAQLEVLLFLTHRYFWRFGCFFKQVS